MTAKENLVLMYKAEIECLRAAYLKEKDTSEKLFQIISEKYEIELKWHNGYKLNINDVPIDFRGPKMPSLAKRVVTSGNKLTAKMIGDSAQSLIQNSNVWSNRGTTEEVLQELKLLWHVLAVYGV